MVEKFIIIGEVSKKHLLPFLLALGDIIYKLILRYYKLNGGNRILDLYSTSIGMSSVYFIPKIIKFTNFETPKEKIIHKRKCLHYFILGIIFIVFTVMKGIPTTMKEEFYKEKLDMINPFAEGAFVFMGIEMIFLTLISIWILKYKYYIHHIIAIICFVIFGNICDYLLDYYSKMIDYGFTINFVEFLAVIADVVFYSYDKYMMEKLFYPYWKICLFIGCMIFCFATLLLIYALADRSATESGFVLIQGFYEYFEKNSAGKIIGKQILIIIFYFIKDSLTILNIYYFNPTFILISFQLSKFLQVLIDDEPNKFYCIIFFIAQFFFLLIYLEILEFNFLNLNNNTKRNIGRRGSIDLSEENGRDSTSGLKNIDINKNYFVHSTDNENDENTEKKEAFIELYNQNDEDSNAPS